MAIDAATVRKVARLARIAEPEDKLEGLAKELSGILNWIEQLNEVATDGVEPMTSAVHVALPMREDVVTDGGAPDKVLANAPKRVGNFYVVPKVVE
jgi:aspartyl-tRNA(Asn)/glutamyl-tRNA(Gln) amidotransferase subunit C